VHACALETKPIFLRVTSRSILWLFTPTTLPRASWSLFGLSESLCNFQREASCRASRRRTHPLCAHTPHRNSTIRSCDEITVEDLSQAGLNEQQGITFICKYREYSESQDRRCPQIATASGSSSVSNSATAGTSDAHLSSTDARVVWRWVTRRSCCARVSLQLVIVFVQMAERRRHQVQRLRSRRVLSPGTRF